MANFARDSCQLLRNSFPPLPCPWSLRLPSLLASFLSPRLLPFIFHSPFFHSFMKLCARRCVTHGENRCERALRCCGHGSRRGGKQWASIIFQKIPEGSKPLRFWRLGVPTVQLKVRTWVPGAATWGGKSAISFRLRGLSECSCLHPGSFNPCPEPGSFPSGMVLPQAGRAGGCVPVVLVLLGALEIAIYIYIHIHLHL